MSIRIIVTLGPATRTREALEKLKARGVDFVRVNMSHSTLEDLRYFLDLAKEVGISFMLDTEGSQVRSGPMEGGAIELRVGENVELLGLTGDALHGTSDRIYLNPKHIISELEAGDILYLDFNGAAISVADTSEQSEGKLLARVIAGGRVGSNKGVGIDSALERPLSLPTLTEKDRAAIRLGLSYGVSHIAASFMRSGAAVAAVREATEGKMRIISKIECLDALRNLDDIIRETDCLLIDRGDLSKEVAQEEIPALQKEIIERAKRSGKGVFVATNLLETMVREKKPTRAEVHDVAATIAQGAAGLALAAETAVGAHPIECVNVLRSLIYRACPEGAQPTLPLPHGGRLVERFGSAKDAVRAKSLPLLVLSEEHAMDVENICTGVFSPLTGFMGRRDLESVLRRMRLENGVVWPVPVTLDPSEGDAARMHEGAEIALADKTKEPFALMRVGEKFAFDKNEYAQKLYGTLSAEHPGVRAVLASSGVFLAGEVTLLKRRQTEAAAYALTPRQVRRMFTERHWSLIVGFHTRNVIHRSHEYIQLEALKRAHADGLFVHPVIGKKKSGDFTASYILRSYERMMQGLYPEDKVVLGAFATYSRYAGPREALFTALCRKNFGCSHFVVGRDHTGVGTFYPPTASHEIFDKFSAKDIGITPVRFGHIFYSEKLGTHVHEHDDTSHREDEKFHISGGEARRMFLLGKTPPEWFMRPEISSLISEAVKRGERVFVP